MAAVSSLSSLKVSYIGTNVGKIYISDVKKRLGLGGAQEGDYTSGQDEYIIWGEIKVFVLTGDVLTSATNGILNHFSTANASWSALNGPPLVLDVGTHNAYEQLPSVFFMTGTTAYTGTNFTIPGLGGTGLNYVWSDEYLARLSIDEYAPTGIAGATGYYYGNAI